MIIMKDITAEFFIDKIFNPEKHGGGGRTNRKAAAEPRSGMKSPGLLMEDAGIVIRERAFKWNFHKKQSERFLETVDKLEVRDIIREHHLKGAGVARKVLVIKTIKTPRLESVFHPIGFGVELKSEKAVHIFAREQGYTHVKNAESEEILDIKW